MYMLVVGVEMFGEFGLVGSLKDNEEGGLLFKLGYLEVGHCSNGDYVVVDIGRKFGEVRYISHEECSAGNKFEGISEYSEVVANSLGDFVVGLDQGTIGSDHFEEIGKIREKEAAFVIVIAGSCQNLRPLRCGCRCS